jgi:hypothetical protein
LRDSAPVRLLSTRAPRQAVLRASSRLASPHPTRPCDLTAWATRDASNRLLPLERMTITRSPYVPGSLEPLSRFGMPAALRGCCAALPRDRAFSRRSRPLRPSRLDREPSCPRPRGLLQERGPIGPAALDGKGSLTPPSRARVLDRAHAPSRMLCPRAFPYGLGSHAKVGKRREPAKTTVTTGS